MFTFNQYVGTQMRFVFLTTFLAVALLTNTDAGAEPLGQEIKQVLQSELDRTEAMAAKMKLIRSRSNKQNSIQNKLETSSFLQVIKRISCEGDPGALMQALESDTEGSVAYVINGRCVIDRFVEVVGRNISIVSEKDSVDPTVSADELATLVFDNPDRPDNGMTASVGSSIILYDLFLESANNKPLRLDSYANAYLTLYNVGYRGEMSLNSYRSGGIFLLDYGSLRESSTSFDGATQSQLAIAATKEDWNINWEMRGGAAGRVYGSYNISFFLRAGSSLEHIGFTDTEDRLFLVDYTLEAGSSAWILPAGFEIRNIDVRSNSTLASFIPLNPERLSVSPSSFVGLRFE